MGKTKRCPACKSDVPAEAEHCPQCPYSWVTDEIYKAKKRFGPGSWHPAVWALLVVAGGVGAWRLIDFVINEADPDANSSGVMRSFVDQRRIVVHDKNGFEKVISAGSGEESGSRAKRVGGFDRDTRDYSSLPSMTRRQPKKSKEDDEEEVTVSQQAAIEEKESKEWRLRGKVYDLVTLAPIPKCSIFFVDPDTRARYESSTDAYGGYKTIIPALRGGSYQVTFSKEGYARSYLNPGAEGVKDMPEPERRSLASDLAKAVDPPYDVQGLGSTPVETDFYLAPVSAN
jgi:hypothetical protein